MSEPLSDPKSNVYIYAVCAHDKSHFKSRSTASASKHCLFVNLMTKLDLNDIALHCRNSEYNPRDLCSYYENTRAQKYRPLSSSRAKWCARVPKLKYSPTVGPKVSRIIQKIGYEPKFSGFMIHNMWPQLS